jgi:hypothetical protein
MRGSVKAQEEGGSVHLSGRSHPLLLPPHTHTHTINHKHTPCRLPPAALLPPSGLTCGRAGA